MLTSVQPHKALSLKLVGHHSLWAHELWNAGVVMGQYFEAAPLECVGKTTLELGAGAAVPSLTVALLGAKKVPWLLVDSRVQAVVTDYPDRDLIKMMEENVRANIPDDLLSHVSVHVR